MPDAYDLIIRGGTIVDGTGGPPYAGDVAVHDGRIAAMGEISGRAAEEIDATGRIVTPGFVDVHTHYDGQVTWETRLSPSSGHGVTTVVMGNCGVGFAPVKPDQHNLMIKLMEGVEDIPEAVMEAGVPFDWETFPDYLDALDRRRTDIDFAAQLPHSPLRVYVMGDRGAALEPPTESDLREMRRLTREAIEAGALGVSTSRNLAHRFRDGRSAPSVHTEEEELMALADGLREAGKGVFQILPNTSTKHAKSEFALIRRVQERSGRPVSFTLLTNKTIPGGWRCFLEGLEETTSDRLPIRGQYYPRPVGMLFGLDLSYHPFSLNPSYKAIAGLPLPERVKKMRDPELRARILSEQPDDPNPFFRDLVQRTSLLFTLGDPPNYLPTARDSIKARAAAADIDEHGLIYDELLGEDGKAILYYPMGNTENDRFDAATDLFEKAGTLIGLGDGGAHYGMVCDAAYPTFVLSQYVKGKAGGIVLPIEQAVRMMTYETAETVGLRDRGVLKAGYKADMNVIALDKLHLHAPRVSRDLPGGGKRLTQQAEGFDATIVSGIVTYRFGQATGKLPGRLVRGAKDRPDPRGEAG